MTKKHTLLASLSRTRVKRFGQSDTATPKQTRPLSPESETEAVTDDGTTDEDDMPVGEISSDGDDTSSPPTPRAEWDRQRTETDTTLERQFRDLASALEHLESPQELRRSYAPQCSNKYSHTVKSTEAQILDEFISMDDHWIDPDTLTAVSKEPSEFWEFNLHNFYVYRSATHPQKSRGKYESLHIVYSELADGHDEGHWLIDGLLEHNGVRKQVVGAAIVQVSIGGFEDIGQYSVNDFIWVKTKESRAKRYWYRLQSASEEYSTVWNPFVWLANFTKYFVDYLYTRSNSGVPVHLADFRANFWQWLDDLHGESIRDWHNQCHQRSDFRHHVSAYRRFLYDQANDIYDKDDGPSVLQQPIWAEISDPKARQYSLPVEKTTVTPNVAASFSEFKSWEKFDLLEVVHLSPEVKEYRKKRVMEWKFLDKFIVNPLTTFVSKGTQRISRVAWILEQAAIRNQTVHIDRHDTILHRVVIVRWNDTFRYAWVRRTQKCNFSVVWLVLPAETLCGRTAAYKIGNELFFTDSCNCDPIPYRDVVEIVEACVQDTPINSSQLFLHLLYREHDEEFVNEPLSNLACRCTHSKTSRPSAPKLKPSTPSPRQNWPKMRLAGLFSGCGLFEAAFTSLNFVELVLAVEIWETAALSHKANHPGSICEVCSVEQLLKAFTSGQKSMIPTDAIMGGFPCRGYSLLNSHRGTRNAEKNCSYLANFLSFVDIFLPAFVLIENVPTMDPSDPTEQNACAQAISFLVSLGYQTRRSVHIDSNFGGASNRKRLFIVATAPRAELPRELVPTHGPGLKESQCVRRTIGDLEPVHNDTMINVANPAHVPLQRLTIDWRVGVNYHAILQRIPEGMSLSKAYHAGLLLRHERQFFRTLQPYQQSPQSKCLKRIDADRPSRTIATLITPMDARFGGEIIHPFQNRCVTLEETRRFQGMPSWFVLIGDIKDQYKQLGNLVPWALGTALGCSFKEAWLATMAKRRATTDSSRYSAQGPSYSTATSGQSNVPVPSNPELKAGVRANMPREIIEISSDEEEGDSASQAVVKKRTQEESGVKTQSATSHRAGATYIKRRAPVVWCSDDSDNDVVSKPIKKVKL
ncbi:uncharacterized protein A1O5_03521 [Cladophialophora psammophila CBS 110553]|uniref:DNA (cytosine-5-)-methyltransferase n=1 Tax=Cladophialophora psammophila CBS 110553 TaxID=1182543 RepID=W9XU00_9EURO|nr:uncharacterized protein A1O5_03521 [Cladophialophora psammophila CBS 110553]EXJ73759.1 hypothetical protein A1O5_03521 [Cladophialophora psammophila CBS 110553]